MQKSNPITTSFICIFLSLWLTSCGGGSSDAQSPIVSPTTAPPSPTPTPPPTLPSTPLYSVGTTAPVPYPAGYTVATTDPKDVNSDPCQLNLPVVTYPQAWMGNRPLPPASGSPFNQAIGRGVILKDIMLDNNPGFVEGCNSGAGSLKFEMTKTIGRIASLGAGYLKLTQWHWATINADGTYGILNAESSFGPLSDDNLAHIVAEAHRMGMKVILYNQIQGFVDQKNQNIIQTPPPSIENYKKWFDTFGEFSLRRAPVYQKMGVDIWEASCDICVFHQTANKTDSEKRYFYERNLDITKSVGKIFLGKRFSYTNDWFDYGPDYLKYLDFLESGLWSNYTYNIQQSDSLTVSAYKAGLSDGIRSALKLGKPIFVSVGIQSRKNALSLPGYMEETGCTGSINDIAISNTQCIQKDTQPDFSLQAIVLQAQLEYIKDIGDNNVIVLVGDYFATDALMTKSVYPQIGYTIRNKPAEGLVRAWFKK